MWVPPSPLGDTTGYRISYNAVGDSSKSVISDGTTSKYTLSGEKTTLLIISPVWV